MSDLLKELRADVKGVERRSSNIGKLLAQFERLRAQPGDNAYGMDDVLKRITKIASDYHSEEIGKRLKAWTDRTSAEISTLKERFRHEFGRRLHTLLESQGFALTGRYPDLKVKFYTIHVDFPNGTASLAFGHELMKSKIPLSAEEIARSVEHAERSLNRPFDAPQFINKLFEAYRRVCRIRDLPSGEKAPIIEVLHQLVLLTQPPQFRADPAKEHYRGYGRTHFGYDLYRLRLSGARTTENGQVGLLTATFDATRNRENFIWVPDNERGDGTTYSLLFFKSNVPPS